MPVPQINSLSEYKTIVSSDNYSVLYFYSTNCYYCSLMSLVVEETANLYAGETLKFYRVDGCASWSGLQNIEKGLKIDGYPWCFIFRGNNPCANFEGYGSYSEFLEWLSEEVDTLLKKNGNIIRACTVNAVESEGNAHENSPLLIFDGFLPDDNSYDNDEPVFIAYGLRTAPYFGPLHAYLKQIAVSTTDARFILFIVLDEDERVEQYFLKHRPLAKFKPNRWDCHFLTGEFTQHFSKWIQECLTANQLIIKSLQAQGDQLNEDESEEFVVEVASKGVLYEELMRAGISVVLCYDSTPHSEAMVTVQEAAARHLHIKGMRLLRVDFEINNEFAAHFNLQRGPTTIIYRDGSQVVEKIGIMSVADFEKWVEQSLNRRGLLPFLESSMEHKSTQSLLPSNLSSGLDPAPRSVSKASRGSSWDAASEVGRLHNRPTCEGGHEDRTKRNRVARLLMKAEPFFDKESGCVITTSSAHEGLQLGRASAGESSFNLTLRLSPDNPLKIEFRVEFVAEPTVSLKVRFESATLTVNFGYDDKHGKSHILNLREVQPRELKGGSTVMQKGKGMETSLSLGVNAISAASIATKGSLTSSTSYSRTTEQLVRGSGEMTPTAHWTFMDDPTGKRGLNSLYELSVVLRNADKTNGEIWVKFWAEAVLKLPGGKERLRLGSKEQPYKRNILLDIEN